MALNNKIINKLNELTKDDQNIKLFIQEIMVNEEQKGHGKNDNVTRLVEKYAKGADYENR